MLKYSKTMVKLHGFNFRRKVTMNGDVVWKMSGVAALKALASMAVIDT